MKVVIGSDERNHLTDVIVAELEQRGYEVLRLGPLAGEAQSWSVVAQAVAERVADGEADEGIVCCWTGTGVSIAANKVPGIRAALVDDPQTAAGARKWNDANVLALSLRRTSEVMAKEILDAWFETQYEPNEEDDAAIGHVADIERKYTGPTSDS
jgi:ribose 5-phosphate isomerase B